jgi:hypothetical protein
LNGIAQAAQLASTLHKESDRMLYWLQISCSIRCGRPWGCTPKQRQIAPKLWDMAMELRDHH